MRVDDDEIRLSSVSSSEPLNYVVLFLVIVVAVTIGNLLSNWITARVAAHELQKASVEASRIMSQTIKNANEAQQAANSRMQAERETRRMADQANRVASPQGRLLAQQCDDWRKAFEQLKSESAKMESDRHCRRYANYIDTGAQLKN